MDKKIYYEVPYEGGFKSGVSKFDSLKEAVEFAAQSYGDIYKITSVQIQKEGKTCI